MSGERESCGRVNLVVVWLSAALGLTLDGYREFTFLPTLSPSFFFLFLMGTFAQVYMCGTRPIKLLILTFHFKFHPPFCINYLLAH